MLIVLGDLIADFSLRIRSFPVAAGDLQKVEYLELGPGGSANVAMMAARLGLEVACLGEVGDDLFGKVVLDGLQRESVDVSGVVVSAGGKTPVAGVVVDSSGEPAYLGHRGSHRLKAFQKGWRKTLKGAQALFSDGWVEQASGADMILDALSTARSAGVPAFFDPGPGNPRVSNAWHVEACHMARVVMATEEEVRRLTGLSDPLDSARSLLAEGTELAVVKRGVAGCVLLTKDEVRLAPGYPVEVRDATAAGDSLDAAVIYGYLNHLPLPALGALANAAGAAKVQKLGTGHNVPTVAEVAAVLERFGLDSATHLPGLTKSK